MSRSRSPRRSCSPRSPSRAERRWALLASPHPEALLAAGYALFLIGTALGLDALARHAHARSERYRTGGFRFHRHLDAWECPEGEYLHRRQVDHERRVVRYRAKAHVCNSCLSKGECTDSDEGREIAHPVDPWPHSEAGRFHRGISLMLALLGTLIAAVELLRHNAPAELVVVLPVLALALVVVPRLASSFRAAKSTFPGIAPAPARAAPPRPAAWRPER